MGIVALDGTGDGGIGKVATLGLFDRHDQECLGPGAGHDAVEQRDRIGDRAGGEILLHAQRLLHHRARAFQRVLALRDADAAEILARGAAFLHVTVGQQREIRIRTAIAIGIGGIGGEAREAGKKLPEAVDLIGVPGHAGDNAGIACLHRPGRAAQRDDARRTAHRDVIEPARAKPQMLGQPDGAVGKQREAGQR